LNVTLPVGKTPEPALVTFAVKVTDVPNTLGDPKLDAVRVVDAGEITKEPLTVPLSLDFVWFTAWTVKFTV
jgi:hypothetical protein